MKIQAAVRGNREKQPCVSGGSPPNEDSGEGEGEGHRQGTVDQGTNKPNLILYTPSPPLSKIKSRLLKLT